MYSLGIFGSCVQNLLRTRQPHKLCRPVVVITSKEMPPGCLGERRGRGRDPPEAGPDDDGPDDDGPDDDGPDVADSLDVGSRACASSDMGEPRVGDEGRASPSPLFPRVLRVFEGHLIFYTVYTYDRYTAPFRI